MYWQFVGFSFVLVVGMKITAIGGQGALIQHWHAGTSRPASAACSRVAIECFTVLLQQLTLADRGHWIVL